MSADTGRGHEDSVTVEDITNNPDSHAHLESTHHHDIVEPDPDSQALVLLTKHFIYPFY